jgi:hypothetical protein
MTIHKVSPTAEYEISIFYFKTNGLSIPLHFKLRFLNMAEDSSFRRTKIHQLVKEERTRQETWHANRGSDFKSNYRRKSRISLQISPSCVRVSASVQWRSKQFLEFGSDVTNGDEDSVALSTIRVP